MKGCDPLSGSHFPPLFFLTRTVFGARPSHPHTPILAFLGGFESSLVTASTPRTANSYSLDEGFDKITRSSNPSSGLPSVLYCSDHGLRPFHLIAGLAALALVWIMDLVFGQLCDYVFFAALLFSGLSVVRSDAALRKGR